MKTCEYFYRDSNEIMIIRKSSSIPSQLFWDMAQTIIVNIHFLKEPAGFYFTHNLQNDITLIHLQFSETSTTVLLILKIINM